MDIIDRVQLNEHRWLCSSWTYAALSTSSATLKVKLIDDSEFVNDTAHKQMNMPSKIDSGIFDIGGE